MLFLSSLYAQLINAEANFLAINGAYTQPGAHSAQSQYSEGLIAEATANIDMHTGLVQQAALSSAFQAYAEGHRIALGAYPQLAEASVLGNYNPLYTTYTDTKESLDVFFENALGYNYEGIEIPQMAEDQHVFLDNIAHTMEVEWPEWDRERALPAMLPYYVKLYATINAWNKSQPEVAEELAGLREDYVAIAQERNALHSPAGIL